jgi:putative phosphoribosyl transferase
MYFRNRMEAGRRLGARLATDPTIAGQDVVVLGLPRGGVPVAAEVAHELHAPLDVLVVRKIGHPYQPEAGIGAIGEGGVRVIDPRIVAAAGVSPRDLERVEARERAELERRVRRYRGDRPLVSLHRRTAVIVDDGIATGGTARAACQVAKALGAGRVVLATPVCPPDVLSRLAQDADDVVCLATPTPFFAIGEFYEDFRQTSDDEVLAALNSAPATRDEEVVIPVDGARLAGLLTVPADATGVVVFVHGSGSSRHSPRNRHVAAVLQSAGLGTLLFDLLTVEEEQHRRNVFDIGLLAARLEQVTAWLRADSVVGALPFGWFGASTGAGAALWAAADPRCEVAAVVSRGGRPDLAAARLDKVRAPTLLVVGGRDEVVLDLNRRALEMMQCEARLEVVPGATHLFEEPGTLDAVAALARDWFVRHLRSVAGTRAVTRRA